MHSGDQIAINHREYRLETVLSTGASSYGQVWAATDGAGRAVALKFINTEAMTQADPSLHSHWRAHLEREIVFLSGLDADQSRHIVTLIDAGLVDDQPVLVMERLQANLGHWLMQQRRNNRPPPDLERILDWAGQILAGLETVHGAGFIYRDLKFSNLLVGADGALIKLADFGALKRETGDSTRSFMGTPATMAPEQVLPVRRDVDGGCVYAVTYRADYYALGLLLFTLITEQPATAAQRRLGQALALHGQEGADQHREELGGLSDEEVTRLRVAIEFWTVPVSTLPARGSAVALTDLMIRLLARDPAARPQHSAEIREVLEAARAGPPCWLGFVPEPVAPVITPDWNALLPRRIPGEGLWRRRTAGLASVSVLVGVLAWAIIPPPIAVIIPAVPDTSTYSDPVRVVEKGKIPPLLTQLPPFAKGGSGGISLPDATTTRSGNLYPQPPRPEPPALVVQPPVPELPTALEPPRVDALVTRVTPRSEPDPEVPAVPEPVPAAMAAPLLPRPALAEPLPVRSRKPVRERPVQKTVKTALPVEPAIKAVKSVPPVIESTIKTVKATPPIEPAIRAVKTRSAVTSPSVKPTSIAPDSARKPSPVVKATPAPRPDKTTARVAHVIRTPAVVMPPASPIKPSRVRAEPVPPSGSRPSSPSALPPIELESRPQTPPPIHLVSRSEPVPVVIPARAVRSIAVPVHSTPHPNWPPPARTADPVTQFREDAGRATAELRHEAEALGNWASRTSAEIQRGLDTANRTVNQWTGNCGSAHHCGRSPLSERRDR